MVGSSQYLLLPAPFIGPSKTPLVGMCGILVLRGNVLDGLDESGVCRRRNCPFWFQPNILLSFLTSEAEGLGFNGFFALMGPRSQMGENERIGWPAQILCDPSSNPVPAGGPIWDWRGARGLSPASPDVSALGWISSWGTPTPRLARF